MIALHGFLGCGRDFSFLREQTSSLFAPDLFSPLSEFLPAGGFSKFCEQFIGAVPREERTLVGYSFGGRLALHLAMYAPDRWDQVTLISTSPGLLTDQEKRARQANDDSWAQIFLDKPWADAMTKWNAQDVFKGSQEPQRFEGDYNRKLLARGLREYSWAQMQTSIERLKMLKNVRWVVGERDTKYMAMFANLRESRVITDVSILPGAGHRAIFDNAVRLQQIL